MHLNYRNHSKIRNKVKFRKSFWKPSDGLKTSYNKVLAEKFVITHMLSVRLTLVSPKTKIKSKGQNIT